MIQPSNFTAFFSMASRNTLCLFLTVTILACSVLAVNAADSQDSQLFINGFNAYQKGDYPATIDKMTQVLTKHPETPLRDMALFWLARANFKAGNQREAARYLSQFNKEYPDSPLKGTIEEDLAALVPRYERGEQLPSATAQLEKTVVIPGDSESLAKEKTAAEQLAAAKTAAENAARVKAEADQAAADQRAAAKATEERLRAEQTEIARLAEAKAAEQIALAKAAAENAAREKAEVERVAAERLAAAQAAEERLKTEKAEAARLAEARAAEQIAAATAAAAAKAEAERQAAEAATAAKLAAARAEAERVAAERAAIDAAAREKLAATMATENALRDQLANEQAARQKAEAEKAAAEKLAAEQIAAAKSDAERQAKTLLAQDEANRRQAETEQRTSREKLLESSLAAEKAAREQAEADKAALEKASSSQLATAQAELTRLEAERIAAQKAAQANLEAALAAERAAREKAEAERAAAEKAAEERVALARAAADKANAERQAAEKAAQEYQATATMALKAANEAKKASITVTPSPNVQIVGAVPGAATVEARLASEQSAREKAETALENERAARLQAEEHRAAAERRAAELLATAQAATPATATAEAPPTTKQSKAAKTAKSSRSKTKSSSQLRDKAVAEYKRIIDRFPGSRAAASATAKLKELGIIYGTPAVEPEGATMTSSARVLAFEVGQYASLDLTGQTTATVAQAGSRIQIPFELTNTGNGPDTFALATAAAADLHAAFAAANAQELPLAITPPLAPGEQFKGVVTVVVPNKAIDGERLTFPIRATSQFTADVSQSREIRIVCAAPLLRAVIKAEKTQLLPGETVTYKISLLNVGSAAGRDLSFRVTYPAQLLPSGDTPGVRREAAGALVLEPITLQSGENRELTLKFQLGADALAQQELFLQGEINNPMLNKRDSFLAQAVTVQTVRGVSATTASGKVTAIPGQKVVIPVTVTNTGNVREDFSLATAIPGSVTYAVYQDQNRDGLKQAGEPVINHVGPLAPREVAHVLLELATASSAADGSSLPIALSFVSDADRNQAARIDVNLLHARPVLDLAVDGRGGKLKPREVSTFVLDCVNRGSSMAKVVELESILPEQLELVAADPAFTRGQNGRYLWAFEELGPGEKRSIKVTYRIKSGIALGTNIQLKNLLSYQDLLGNRY